MQPSFVSVTYGAGGSTRERTHDLIVRIQRETNLTAVSHLTCVCHIAGRAGGDPRPLRRLGDREHPGPRRRPAPRHGRTTTARSDAFQYADGLVAFIKRVADRPDPRGFGIGVAGFPEGHPGTPNRLKEMDYLKRKVDAGADYICTQLFFDNDDFYDFRERCELAGIQVPIVAGIMPITSKAGMVRMAELALGARFPARLLRAVDRCGDDRGGRQGRHPLGDRAVPRPARQQGPRHPLLHAQPVGRDPADLREPGRQGLAGACGIR